MRAINRVAMLAAMVAVVACLAGCVSTHLDVTTADGVTAKVDRVAVGYKAQADIEVDGWGKMTGYRGNPETEAFTQALQMGMGLAAQAYGLRQQSQVEAAPCPAVDCPTCGDAVSP